MEGSQFPFWGAYLPTLPPRCRDSPPPPCLPAHDPISRRMKQRAHLPWSLPKRFCSSQVLMFQAYQGGLVRQNSHEGFTDSANFIVKDKRTRTCSQGVLATCLKLPVSDLSTYPPPREAPALLKLLLHLCHLHTTQVLRSPSRSFSRWRTLWWEIQGKPKGNHF